MTLTPFISALKLALHGLRCSVFFALFIASCLFLFPVGSFGRLVNISAMELVAFSYVVLFLLGGLLKLAEMVERWK